MNTKVHRLLWLVLAVGTLQAQDNESPHLKTVGADYSATLHQKREDAAMQKWRANRFGQFFHFGIYSILGSEYKGKRVAVGEWIQSTEKISKEEYGKLLKVFNPQKFDAEKWAEMNKAMGVKYMTITTKHHDGFCLWPTKHTEFSVKNTPYEKDLIGPLVKAYTKLGIDVTLYYSVMDWNHPDYRVEIRSEEDKEAMARYMNYAMDQLDELLTLYPEAKAIWFDGQWDPAFKNNPQWGWALEQSVRKKSPHIIINNRVRSDVHGNLDRDQQGRHYADYDSSFERKLPNSSSAELPKSDWEACYTIMENGWGYSHQLVGHLKDSRELIEALARCVSRNGNFLINFGPKPDGTIRDYELKLAKEMGQWMQVNGAAIYGASGVPIAKPSWGYITRNGNKRYLIVFNQSENIQIPFESANISQLSVLGAKDIPIIKKAAGRTVTNLDLSALPDTNIAHVIEFTLDGHKL